MTEVKFTPGPWEILARGGYELTGTEAEHAEMEGCEAYALREIKIKAEASGVNPVSQMTFDPRYTKIPHEANAHLIAAAPDLYEALDTLRDVVGLTAFKYHGQMMVVQEACDKARAALAKARGEI